MLLSEAAFRAALRCPVGDLRSDLFEDTVLAETRSVIAAAANLRLLDARAARNALSGAWEAKKPLVPTETYVQGHRGIPAIALRLVQVIRDYQITFPIHETELRLECGELLVEYGVCRPWRKAKDDTEGPWFCLSVQRGRSPAYWRYPDPVVLARWLDLQLREPARSIKVLHLPLLSGTRWVSEGLSPVLVRQQLNGMLFSLSGETLFSKPGPHCESCASHRCLELTYER